MNDTSDLNPENPDGTLPETSGESTSGSDETSPGTTEDTSTSGGTTPDPTVLPSVDPTLGVVNALPTEVPQVKAVVPTGAGAMSNSWVGIPTGDFDLAALMSDPTSTVEVNVVRYDQFVQTLLKQDTETMMALHCGLGVAGEAGELADAIKREYIYNKPRDLLNVKEELGDLFWYIHATLLHYNLSEQEVLQYNALKLAKRYKSLSYTDEAAQARADKSAGQ